MKVIIDGAENEMELEELSLISVLSLIENGLIKIGRTITRFSINGSALPDQVSIEAITLEESDVLTIDSISEEDRLTSGLAHWIRVLTSSPEEAQITEEDLQEVSSFVSLLGPMRSVAESELALWKAGKSSRADLASFFKQVSQVIEDPTHVIDRITGEMVTFISSIEPILTQAAQGELSPISTAMEKFIKNLSLLDYALQRKYPESVSFPELELLRKSIAELDETLEKQDFIALSDLIEYEICPRASDIVKRIENCSG